ncbi:diguanylate cyclase (GGDEF)-like protein [Pseudonocardia autotrophica]|uniref:GGDEF domain-containing protein n=3 Tax=Pseudonocardiaceae TaxID=2070 RepID=A0ABQ0S049_9PSEU|nr:putative diguanylate cyclase YcdT [Pseudonocardia autotrophica]TDN71094.1 diguanylate cyclase (GGDEF)-like protein [Pseudonocardia autotrophica]BBG01764.1 GGDEF domain-containing protein [Pseudonocardia autotrophica]GEC26287.1 GGDEF domain-containing protein [Pseudonocardia saturnea]
MPPRAGRRRFPFRSWQIGALPPAALVFILSVDVLAVGLLVACVLRAPVPTGEQLLLAGLLSLVPVAHTELSLHCERTRRRVARNQHVDMTSVWTFCGALLLPPVLAVAVVVAVHTHRYLRVARAAGTPAHRHLFSAATVLLAVCTVGAIRYAAEILAPAGSDPGGATVVLVALLGYSVVSTLLVACAVRLTRPGTRFLSVLLGAEFLLELASLSLGGLVAVIIDNTSPWLALLAVLPLLVLEQTTLVRQLENQVDTDTKTGLLNPSAWRWRAQQMIEQCARTERATAVLLLDLDHFKAVNDRHGHLAGDDVLRAVASVLTAEVRDDDLAGRFGGEEFVVALGGLRPDDVVFGRAREVAERIRRSVRALEVDTATAGRVGGLSVSIGVATSCEHSGKLDALLAAADAALYEAKRGGRDQVRVRHPEAARHPGTATPPFGLHLGTGGV